MAAKSFSASLIVARMFAIVPGSTFQRAVKGDFLDVDSLRTAFDGVSTLFLLNAVVPDEFT